MKKLTLAAMLVFAATAASADPIFGLWKTKPDDNGNFGHIKVQACGSMVCGTLVKAFDGTGKQIDSPNVGKKIIWDMVAYPDGVYDDGKVWSPDRDKTYDSDMKLSGNSLKVRGCVLGICRDGGQWSRVK
jgi:uncharacterized protein (DUF2147 family)